MDQNVSVCAHMLQDQPACRNVFVQSSHHLRKTWNLWEWWLLLQRLFSSFSPCLEWSDLTCLLKTKTKKKPNFFETSQEALKTCLFISWLFAPPEQLHHFHLICVHTSHLWHLDDGMLMRNFGAILEVGLNAIVFLKPCWQLLYALSCVQSPVQAGTTAHLWRWHVQNSERSS